MRRICLLTLLVLAVALSPASAAHGFTHSGTILGPNPSSRKTGGAAERLSPCEGSVHALVPNGVADGTDGAWIELPAGLAGHDATLTSPMPNDVDAWFYDSSCALIPPSSDPNAFSMAGSDPLPDFDEDGTIPEGAAWVVIDLYVGAAAPFTFTVAP